MASVPYVFATSTKYFSLSVGETMSSSYHESSVSPLCHHVCKITQTLSHCSPVVIQHPKHKAETTVKIEDIFASVLGQFLLTAPISELPKEFLRAYRFSAVLRNCRPCFHSSEFPVGMHLRYALDAVVTYLQHVINLENALMSQHFQCINRHSSQSRVFLPTLNHLY